MSRFRKLNLQEAQEAFELIDESTRKSLKGGTGGSSSGILDPEDNLGLYSFNRFADLSQDDPLGVSVMSRSSTGWDVDGGELDDAYCYGTKPGSVDYGSYCMTHHIYFPRNGDCYECGYDGHGNDNYGNNYYGDSYYYGENNYGGNNGGTWFPGGGGAGTGSNNNSSSPSSDGIKFVYPKENQPVNTNTCVTMCITQTLLTYGFTEKEVTLSIVIDKAAKAIYDNPGKCDERYAEMSLDAIKRDLNDNGIIGSDIPLVLKAFFDVSEIQKANPRTDEAKDPDSSRSTEAAAKRVSDAIENGKVVIAYYPEGDGMAHCVVITQIDKNVFKCYNPMELKNSIEGKETGSLASLDMKLYEVSKK